MSMSGLTKMTKVEVVVTGADAPDGYTAVSGVSGFGHHGLQQGRLLFNDQAPLEMLITVVPEDRRDGLVAGLRRLLEERPGVMFVSETWVSRPEFFA
jgi:hypothetical protein